MFITPNFKRELRLKRVEFLRRRNINIMASSQVHTPPIATEDLTSFSEHLKKSNRILALCGAGLSAASGLPTFRGAGGLWRNNDATELATPEAFELNAGLVWQFYGYRRHMALQASPNPFSRDSNP